MLISIVIPVYNEETNLSELYRRLRRVFEGKNFEVEFIFVDDGSRDQSLAMLREIHVLDPRVKIVVFSRNFGHQIAVSAGIKFSSGDAVIVMDGDLQDPPEAIPHFIAKWQEGYDVVYAIRTKRKENIFKRFSYFTFYRLLRKVSNIDIPLDSGDFCIMSRRVADMINAMPEHHRFVRGLRSWIGLKQTGLSYEREGRFAGKTKYKFFGLVKLALDGIISFSHMPLKIASVSGLLTASGSFMAIVAVIFLKLFTNIPVKGVSALAVMVLFLGGVQLLLLGVVGEYIARIHDEVKGRPLYAIETTIGFSLQNQREKIKD